MMRVVRNVKTLSIFCVFSIYICISGIGSNSARAQFTFNPLFGNLFDVSQSMPTYSPLFTTNYQLGQQAWNPFGSNIYPDFGTIPVGHYSGSTQTKEMVKGELIVHLSDQVQIEQHANGPRTNMPELNALLDLYGVSEIESSSSGGFYVLKFSKSHDVNDMREAFEGVTEYVVAAEPNYIRKAHSTTPSFNTMMGGMMGGWSPQLSSLPGQSFLGQGVYNPGTAATFRSWMPTAQQSYLDLPSLQFPFSSGLTFGSSWQTQDFTFMSPSFNPWLQTSWERQQPYYNINLFSPTGRWF